LDDRNEVARLPHSRCRPARDCFAQLAGHGRILQLLVATLRKGGGVGAVGKDEDWRLLFLVTEMLLLMEIAGAGELLDAQVGAQPLATTGAASSRRSFAPMPEHVPEYVPECPAMSRVSQRCA